MPEAVSLGDQAREGQMSCIPQAIGMRPRKSEALQWVSSGVRGWGPGPSPRGEGSLTEEAGQDPHVCRVGLGMG